MTGDRRQAAVFQVGYVVARFKQRGLISDNRDRDRPPGTLLDTEHQPAIALLDKPASGTRRFVITSL